MAGTAVLEVERLTKRYGGGALANDGIDLRVAPGEVFGLLGPNGAGKTTLVGQVLGLLRPTSGSIRIAGVDVVADPASARRLCSYQPQGSVPVEGLTPREAIELVGRIRGGSRSEVRRRVDHLLDAVDLGPWAQSLSALSGGVARLVGFCMAAVVPGRIVVLDEPTNDVDPLRRRQLWRTVRELADAGSAILLVTHNVLEAERCVDRLAIVNGGRVAIGGTPATMRAGLADTLRLELAVEPGRDIAEPPAVIRRPFATGTRIVAEVSRSDVRDAIAWADQARSSGVITEFALSPASLEDVYARAVGDGRVADHPGEDEHVALSR